ncbi:uncharacterized protein [Eurosta solidaginis]|uniref:uncharacterized protein n=1 Tax=Eurosta solidaginis TaxID=178769 RepID=UPI003530D832
MNKFGSIQEKLNISRNTFHEILDFCLKENNYFMYEGKIFTQTYGMPMGNPLSTTIADIVMDDILEYTTLELKNVHNIEIKFIVKYVDDIFAIVRRTDVDIILKTLNEYHNKLKFTVEKEENLSIPFLDVKLHREANKVILNWYSKLISSGRIINFLSAHPLKYKINTARNLVQKILTISHHKFKEANIQKIHKILKSNNFPSQLINNLIEDTLMSINNKHIKQTTTNTDTDNNKFFSVTYIPKLTEKFNRDFDNKKHKITLAYKPNCTLSSVFTKTKSPVELQEQNNVVYEIRCNGKENEQCNKVYIGTTKRPLGVRLSEHEADIRKKKDNTALSQHILNSGHEADIKNTKILDVEKRGRIRYTMESLRILEKREETVNIKEDTKDIAAIYLLCLQNTKHKLV